MNTPRTKASLNAPEKIALQITKDLIEVILSMTGEVSEVDSQRIEQRLLAVRRKVKRLFVRN
jgi:hypothetical protein